MRRPEHQEDVDLLALAAEEAAHFGREVIGDAAHVRGDPALLRRMIRNLLDNAQRHAAGATRVEVRRAQDRVRLLVEDHGPGIPPAACEKVFEPFHRGHARGADPAAPSAGDYRGTGLGLAIVRQVARAHGGDVTCEPADAAGTRFVVVLPAAG
jgi:signal transduction histidine kinase